MISTKPLVLALCIAVAGCAGKSESSAEAAEGGHWWWPFGKSEQTVADVPKIDQKATQAWLDEYEPKLRESLKGTKFEVERRENVLAITAPVDSSFNKDRPNMLLPATLGSFTAVAKMLEADPKTAVLVLGHADSTGKLDANRKLSEDRAKAVAAIFRLSGLQRDRLLIKGVGPDMPRAANDSVEGRALNRRVELLLTPQDTLVALLARYNQPAVAIEKKPAADQAAKTAAK